MSMKMIDLVKFEESLVDSCDKLSFIYYSLNSVSDDDLHISRKYAQHVNKVVKSILEDVEFARDTFFDTKLYDQMQKLKKKEIEIELGGE